MRRVVFAVRSLITDAIGLDGLLFTAGLAGLTVVAWSSDWRYGVAVASIAALTMGLAVARPQKGT